MTLFDFNSLLRRYLDGHATPDELRLIDRWYDSLSKSLSEDVAYPFTPAEQARLKARMWQQIDARTADKAADEAHVLPLLATPDRPGWQRTWAITATVSLLLLGGWAVYSFQKTAQPGAAKPGQFQGELAALSAGMTEQSATTAPRSVTLPDGSEVYLKPHSAIRYVKQLTGNERVAYLVGDAFFKVTKNPRRPFRVVTEQVETQVLGTSFWVKTTAPNNQVDVEVLTGKVHVYERVRLTAGAKNTPPATSGVVLTPNQKVTVTGQEHWQTGLVAYPQPIAPETALAVQPRPVSLRFDNIPFATVCQQLTQLYGIDLDLANADMATCTFTGDLTSLPLFDQLTLLCSTVNARYDVRGTHILISGRGCQP